MRYTTRLTGKDRVTARSRVGVMKASLSFTESRFDSGLVVVWVCLLMMNCLLSSPAAAAHLGDTRQKEQFESAQKALWNDPKLTDDDRFNIRSAGVQRIAYYLQFKGYFINLDDFEKSVRELRREFPKRDEPYELLLVLAKNRFWDDQMDKARAGAEELAARSGPPSIVEDARSMLKRFARVGQPLAFKFTALDGRE